MFVSDEDHSDPQGPRRVVPRGVVKASRGANLGQTKLKNVQEKPGAHSR